MTMQIGTLDFIQSDGGPLIAVPHRVLTHWTGTKPPTDGRRIDAPWQFDPSRPATDYDRACNAPGLVSTLSVDDAEALVLGSFTDNAAWLPLANEEYVGAFVRLLSIDDEVHFMSVIQDIALGPVSGEVLTWRVVDRVRLFDSASTRGASLRADYVDIDIPQGEHLVETTRYHDPQVAEAVLHRVSRR